MQFRTGNSCLRRKLIILNWTTSAAVFGPSDITKVKDFSARWSNCKCWYGDRLVDPNHNSHSIPWLHCHYCGTSSSYDHRLRPCACARGRASSIIRTSIQPIGSESRRPHNHEKGRAFLTNGASDREAKCSISLQRSERELHEAEFLKL